MKPLGKSRQAYRYVATPTIYLTFQPGLEPVIVVPRVEWVC